MPTDLQSEQTDINQYLLPDSCNPKTTKRAIPKSTDSKNSESWAELEIRDKRMEQIKHLLLNRGYEEKSKGVSRKAALKILIRSDHETRPVISTTFDPGQG